MPLQSQYTVTRSIAFLAAQVSAAQALGTRTMAAQLERELQYALVVEEEKRRREQQDAVERGLMAQAAWEGEVGR